MYIFDICVFSENCGNYYDISVTLFESCKTYSSKPDYFPVYARKQISGLVFCVTKQVFT